MAEKKLLWSEPVILNSGMGAHYRSIQVQGDSRNALIMAMEDRLRAQNGRALIGPTINGWTGVYLDDSAPSRGLAATLAKQLNTTVLELLVHDSDIFGYDFYRGEQLIDEYSSRPDYFEQVSPAEREHQKGNAEAFRELLGADKKVGKLDSLLKAHHAEEFLFEENRLENFAKLLGIENTLASYDYLTNGEWDGIKGRSQFVHIPDLTAAKAAAKAASAALRAEMRRLKKERILCFESKPPGKAAIATGGALFDPVHGGMLFTWSLYGRLPGEPGLWRAKPPWESEPEPVEIPAASASPYHLVLSRTGKWFAYSDGQLRLWNWPEQKSVGDVSIQSSPVCFNYDENLLLCTTQQGFEIFSIESKEITMKIPAHPHFLAWHPSGMFLVIRPRQDQLGLIDLNAGKLTKILYSGTVSDRSNLTSLFSGQLKEAGIPDEQLDEMKQCFVRGSDEPFSVKFSPDGRLLFCATTRGLRVLEWDKVLAAEKITPPPLFTASPMPLDSPLKAFEKEDYINYVYDVVFDENRNRLLFCGIEGAIRFLNLDDARTGVLFKPPGKDYICRLQLSPDSEFLCCTCTPPFEDRNKKPHSIRVWNYRLLRMAAGIED